MINTHLNIVYIIQQSLNKFSKELLSTDRGFDGLIESLGSENQ